MPSSSEPRTRRLTVFGRDPAARYKGGALTVEVEVPVERLEAGPRGARVQVIDFDASTNTLYRPLRIGEADAWAGETDVEKLVGDPGFHAQNVYAIVMATLGRFERALGRRASFAFPGGGLFPGAAPGRGHVLKVAPHAFAEANAFYSRRDEGLMFGYFPGRRGTVFTCLAHDIVAHETAHALLDGLRPRYSDPSSPDQAAFHEGFADVVALLSLFRHARVVEAALGGRGKRLLPKQLAHAALRKSALLALAEQMGAELSGVRGDALRRSAELPPSRSLLKQDEYLEPHTRGEVFVAAMLNAFLEVWVRRIRPLGLDQGHAVDRERVIEEGAEAAGHLLTMAIRALDYAPPVDLQFADFLSALLTADHELFPDDGKYRYREALLDWFRQYGIDPIPTKAGVMRGAWDPPERPVSYARTHFESLQHDPDEAFQFLWQNREALELSRDAYTYVPSVRSCTRLDVDGFTLKETVVEYVQILDLRADELARLSVRKPAAMPSDQRVRLYGGGALIFDEFGQLKYHVGSGVAGAKQTRRLAYLFESGFFSERQAARRRFASLHRDRALGRSSLNGERW